MKRYSFQILCIFVVTLILASRTFAAWQKETVPYYNSDGSLAGYVTFDVNQSGQQSSFTIFKRVRGMRVYMTFFGVTYPGFKRYMRFDKADWTQTGTGYTLPDPNDGSWIGGIAFTELEDIIGTIKLKMYISDHFAIQYGKPVKVAFNIVGGNPGQAVGPMPDVDIIVENADISSVRVTYPRPQVSIDSATTQVVANISGGIVTVKCNDNNDPLVEYGGSIGGVIVNGGFVGDLESPNGIGLISTSARKVRVGKKKLARLGFGQGAKAQATLVGGVIGGTITTKGQINTIFAGNGLGAPAGNGVPSEMKPKIACGYDGSSSYGRNIKKIIAKRGAWGATVAAGSAASTASPAFLGGIGKVVVTKKSKGAINYDGGASLSNGCNFISYNKFKLCGSGVKEGTAFCANSFNVVPWGTLSLDENFVEKASKLP